MVRNYIRKTNRRPYTTETLQEALTEIRAGRLNAYRASKNYKIPISTLMDHVKGTHGVLSQSLGRGTALSKEQETRLANCIKKMQKYGFVLSRKEVKELVAQFIKANKLRTPFKDDYPGEDWFRGFQYRNSLSIKQPHGCCNPVSVEQYFNLLEKTIKDLGLEDSPDRIWNIDETSFCTDTSTDDPWTKILCGSGGENITVLLAASALGVKVPPHIIFNGLNFSDEWCAPENSGFPGTTYAATANAWMETGVFEDYFEKQFLKSIGPNRPVLLIYNGPSIHISIQLLEKASESNVTILKLPPHSSHVLQPLETAFKPFKTLWDQKLATWQMENIGVEHPKKQSSIMIGEIWRDFKPEIIQNGFKTGGIYPFSNDVVPDSMFNTICKCGFLYYVDY